MAEIAFKATTNGPGVAHWKIGDIVAVQENGFNWGLLESKEKWIAAGRIGAEWDPAQGFFILKLPSVTVAQVLYFLEEYSAATATQGNRRLWRFNVESLTGNQLAAMLAKGFFESGVDLTDAQCKDKIRRKDTNAAATW
jgi:hypothetical protein